MTLKFKEILYTFVGFVRETVKNYFKGIVVIKGGLVKCPYNEDTYTNRFYMKLTPIAANQNEVEFTNGTQVFFSYKTPVAAYCPSRGYIRTANWFSSTTTRHINKWLDGVTRVTEVPQTVLQELVG